MAYGLSNGHVTDDITWPRKVKLVTPIRLERNISKTTWPWDFKFGMQLCMGNAERQTFQVLSKYVSHWEYTYTASKSQKLDSTELLHIANEMYGVCYVHSARQFAGAAERYI